MHYECFAIQCLIISFINQFIEPSTYGRSGHFLSPYRSTETDERGVIWMFFCHFIEAGFNRSHFFLIIRVGNRTREKHLLSAWMSEPRAKLFCFLLSDALSKK